MKHKLRQFLTTLLFTPISYVAVILFVQLFYKCFNTTMLSAYIFVAIVGAWFLAKRFQIRWFSQIAVLIIIPLILLALYTASQNCARCSGPGAVIKQSIGNIRSQAELYFNSNQYSYLGVCQDENVNLLKESIENQQVIVEQKCLGPLTKLFMPDFMANSHFNCNDSEENYAVEAYLPTTQEGAEFWCADSAGLVGEIENSIEDSLSCQ